MNLTITSEEDLRSVLQIDSKEGSEAVIKKSHLYKMKNIITLLLLVFSASVLNARSVKLRISVYIPTNLMQVTITDSKYTNRVTHQILIDGAYVSISKNKDVLEKISDYLDKVRGARCLYDWDRDDVIGVYDIAGSMEDHFIWSDYQVSRHPDEKTGDKRVWNYYFYKQD